MQGYAKEKTEMERSISMLEEGRCALAEELERANLRLGQYEATHEEIEAREAMLHQQRQSLEQSVGDAEQSECRPFAL